MAHGCHGGAALVLQIRGSLADLLTGDDFGVEFRQGLERGVELGDAGLHPVLRILSCGAVSVADCVDVRGQGAGSCNHLALGGGVGGVRLQGDEGILHCAELAAEIGVGPGRALHGIDRLQAGAAGLQAGDQGILGQ